MTTALVLLAVVTLLAYGLERNHQPHNRLAGSTDIEDRDTARMAAELRATVARPRPEPQRATARMAATTRLAIGSR